MIGHILKERYRIEEALGEGAMGKVYRAYDLESGDYVAVKTISREHAADEEYRKRFGRETAALRKLNHPHIVGYVDAFSLDGIGFLVTDFLGGGTLRTVMKARGQLPEGLFKNIALKILDAVASAHEAGVIHRDLKPENILMTVTGEPKVADFGLARVADLSTMTQTGTIMGTLAYMPPEAFDTFVKVDHRMDIWALGVIMFEMLTGNLPFRARTQAELIAAILADPSIPLVSARKDVPPAWTDIIAGCLDKKLNTRYQSARDVLLDLRSDRGGVAAARVASIPQETDPAVSRDMASDNPAAVEGSVQSSEPPKQGEYQFQFIKPEPAPTIHQQPTAMTPARPAKVRDYKNLAQEDFDRKGKPANFGMMIFSGLFVYGGIGLTLLSAGLTLVSFAQGEEGMGISFITLSILQAMGALMFGIGVFFEAMSEEGLRQWMMLSLTFSAGFVWFVLMSGIVFPAGFFGTLLGMTFFLLMMAAYMQYKRGM